MLAAAAKSDECQLESEKQKLKTDKRKAESEKTKIEKRKKDIDASERADEKCSSVHLRQCRQCRLRGSYTSADSGGEGAVAPSPAVTYECRGVYTFEAGSERADGVEAGPEGADGRPGAAAAAKVVVTELPVGI